MPNLEELLPEGYRIKDNGLYYVKPGKNESIDVQICNFLPYIVTEIIRDDGQKNRPRL